MNIKLFKCCRLLTVYIRTSSMVSVVPIRVFEFEIGLKLPTKTVQITHQLSGRILVLYSSLISLSMLKYCSRPFAQIYVIQWLNRLLDVNMCMHLGMVKI